MSRSPVRVVKVGGSLFTLASLAQRLDDWLNRQTPARNILIAGGGKLADVIREMDRRFMLGEDASHWLCIDALSLSAQLLSTLLPRSRRANTLMELNERLAAGPSDLPIVFCPRHFMQVDEPVVDGIPLPCNWNATTDSIAARLAQAIAANELVLLKSAAPPGEIESSTGYVDPCFAIASRQIPHVRMENLRRHVTTDRIRGGNRTTVARTTPVASEGASHDVRRVE